MSKKIFNQDFNKAGDYVFSFNLLIMSEGLDPTDPSVDGMKQYDGYVVYPYDKDSKLHGHGDLCGFIIRPQWCYLENRSKGKRAKSSRFYSRRHDPVYRKRLRRQPRRPIRT